MRTAHGPWLEREGIIIRLEHTRDGATAIGYGEAAPISWFGMETVDEVEAACAGLGEWIDDAAVAGVSRRLSSLRHALWAAARDAGVTLGNAEKSDPRVGENENYFSARCQFVHQMLEEQRRGNIES